MRTPPGITERILLLGCLLLAAAFFLSFLYIGFSTLNYPFHLEWMEGQIIDVVQRVVDGKPLYTPPAIEYVPFIYTPLYYYVSAFAALFTGVDFFPARLVSFLSAIGIGAIMYAWLRKENVARLQSLVAAGLFFATYKLSGRWFDVARIDSFFLLLTLSGLFVFFHYHGRKTCILAGMLLAAAFFTKQAAVMMAVPVLLAWLLIDWRKSVMTGGVMALLILAGCAVLYWQSDGWFYFYAFEIPAGHPWNELQLWRFWSHEILKPLGVLCLLAIILTWRLCASDKKKACAYAALAIGLIGGSYVMRLHSYSYLNVLMPAHAALALLAGLSLPYLAALHKKWLMSAAYMALAVQLAVLAYHPLKLIPTQEDVRMGAEFLNEIAKVPGDIFMPELQFVQTRVGKKSYAFGMAAADLFRSELGKKNYIKNDLRFHLSTALRNQEFAAIMPGRIFRMPESRGKYAPGKRLGYPDEYVTGRIKVLWTRLYMRKGLPPMKPDSGVLQH